MQTMSLKLSRTRLKTKKQNMIVSGSLYKKEVDLEALVYQFAEWWRTNSAYDTYIRDKTDFGITTLCLGVCGKPFM